MALSFVLQAIRIAFPIGRQIRKIFLSVREGANHHRRYWDLHLTGAPSSSYLLTVPTVCAAGRIAVELELPSVGGQLRKGSVMTGGARLSGLAREARNRRGRPW